MRVQFLTCVYRDCMLTLSLLLVNLMAGRLEERSVDDICEWLEGKGFSNAVLDIIKGNF